MAHENRIYRLTKFSALAAGGMEVRGSLRSAPRVFRGIVIADYAAS